MEKIRYKYEARDNGETLMGKCDLVGMITCISRQAQIVHSRMKDQDPEAARAFQEMLGALFSDPTSPAWDRVEVGEGPGIDFFHMKRENRGGGMNMRVLRKEPGGLWKPAEVKNELEALRRAVGGKLESFTFAEDACILCDEEGRMKGKPYNTTCCGVDFLGTILIVGTDDEDFTDLTEEQEGHLRNMGIIP